MVKVGVRANGKQVLIRTAEDEKNNFSFLDIVNRVDLFPIDFENIKAFQENVYYLTTHHGIKVGFVCKFIIMELRSLIPSVLLDETFSSID